jgi:hypothetical protein
MDQNNMGFTAKAKKKKKNTSICPRTNNLPNQALISKGDTNYNKQA